MSAYVVTRWKRYGHDRLYVAVEGEQVGYYDLLGDTAWAKNPVDTAVVDSAAADWKQANLSADVEEPTGIGPPPAPDQIRLDGPPIPSVLPGGGEGESAAWADLSSVRPGASARAQAQALRDAAPVRTFFARALGVKTNERAWRIGADGEEAVATQLAKLGPRWHVLHAVPVGARGSDIDHVVIGPAGVFTLNAKHHPNANVWVYYDAFKVNGTKQPYVRNSRFEARRAAKLLSGAVGAPVVATGVVVVLGAHKGFTVKAQPSDVWVVARRRVVPWLLGLPDVLNDVEVAEIWEQARRSTTWQ